MTRNHPLPPAADYRAVFPTAKYWLQRPQQRLMEEHLRSPAHTATATELATKMGYSRWGSISVRYGQLAAAVTERLQKLGVPWSVSDSEPALVSLVIFQRAGDEQHRRWTMRPELVEALQLLGWK